MENKNKHTLLHGKYASNGSTTWLYTIGLRLDNEPTAVPAGPRQQRDASSGSE